jgi:hypothetical protein
MSAVPTTKKSERKAFPGQDFDLETLYVECSRCGRPLIWEKGTTTFIIQSSGIDKNLGSDWLMLSRGCPVCSPDDDEFVLTLARPSYGKAVFSNKKIRSN